MRTPLMVLAREAIARCGNRVVLISQSFIARGRMGDGSRAGGCARTMSGALLLIPIFDLKPFMEIPVYKLEGGIYHTTYTSPALTPTSSDSTSGADGVPFLNRSTGWINGIH